MLPGYGTPIPQRLAQAHSGKPIFVLGNGPSLKDQDLDPLVPHITVGTNRIGYLMVPTYLVICDKTAFVDHRDSVEAAWKSGSTILLADHIRWGSGLERVYHFPTHSHSPVLQFNTDPAKGIGRCANVVYVAMQLVFYFGGSPVYLLGCDYTDYSKTGGKPVRCIDTEADFIRQQSSGVSYSDGYPQADLIMRGFEFVRQYAEKHNIHVYNAAPESQSNLKLFPFAKYPDDCFPRHQQQPARVAPTRPVVRPELAYARSWGRG